MGLRSNASIAVWMRLTPAGDLASGRRPLPSTNASRYVAGDDRQPRRAARRCGDGGARACDGPRASSCRCRARRSGRSVRRARRSRRRGARRAVPPPARCAPAARRPAASPSHRCRRSGGARSANASPAFDEVGVGGQHAGPLDAARRRPRRPRAQRAARPPRRAARSAMASTSIARNSIRAHRDEIVTRSCGTKSARIDERRRRRRLLDRLQQSAPHPPVGGGGTRRGSSPCGRPRSAPATPCGRSREPARTRSRRRHGRPRGRRGARRAARGRRCAGAGRRSRAAAPRRPRGSLLLGRPGRADEEVGVHRAPRPPRRAVRPRPCWPTTASHTEVAACSQSEPFPHGRRGSRRPRRPSIASRRSRPTGRDRRPPSAANPRSTRAWKSSPACSNRSSWRLRMRSAVIAAGATSRRTTRSGQISPIAHSLIRRTSSSGSPRP